MLAFYWRSIDLGDTANIGVKQTEFDLQKFEM